jgi:hypothetical protein
MNATKNYQDTKTCFGLNHCFSNFHAYANLEDGSLEKVKDESNS